MGPGPVAGFGGAFCDGYLCVSVGNLFTIAIQVRTVIVETRRFLRRETGHDEIGVLVRVKGSRLTSPLRALDTACALQ